MVTCRSKSFQNYLMKNGNKPRSVNDKVKHLSAILGYAVKWELLKENPCKGIQHLKVPKNPPKFLTGDQIVEILEVAEKHSGDIYLVYALGIYAGLYVNGEG